MQKGESRANRAQNDKISNPSISFPSSNKSININASTNINTSKHAPLGTSIKR